MPRPNLLFIFTDEQRADTMAAYGNDRVEMPNLNRLASMSTVFERTYVTQPVCTPSRSSIMTGQYPHTNGCTQNNIPLDLDVPTIAEMLPADEYATGYFGKWHLGDELYAQHGFDEWIGIEDGYNRHFRDGLDKTIRSGYHDWAVAHGYEPENGDRFGRGEATRLPEEHGKPAFLAEQSSRFLRERAQDGSPFALFVNYLEPHMPFFGPRDDQHSPEDVTLPANFDNPPDETRPLRERLNHGRFTEDGFGDAQLRTEADWRRMIANYWGLCSLVDTHTGTILRTLEETGLDSNTIVVYTSDHGDMMGSHQMLTKSVMLEEAQRVPLLIRVPRQTSQRRVATPVSQVDLVPTLLELMEQPVPDDLDGVSLAGAVRSGESVADRRDVFVEWNGNSGDEPVKVPDRDTIPEWQLAIAPPERLAQMPTERIRGIVTPDGWKFNWSTIGDHELYHLAADPHETRNLAADPAQAEKMHELAGRIRAWQERTRDSLVLPELG